MRDLPLTTRVLLALTLVVAGVTSLAALAAPVRGEGGTTAWMLLFVAAAFGEILRVNGDSDGGHTTDFTFSSAVLVAAAALYGPAPAGLIAVAALGLVDVVRGAAPLKLAFNAVVYGVAGALGSLAFAWGGGTYGVVDEASIPALLLLVVVHACVTTVLVGAVTGSVRGFSPLQGVLVDARELPPKVMEYSLGVILALQVAVAPSFTPLLVPLLLAVYRQHARSQALHRETEIALRHLADIVDERDAYTYEHSQRVGRLVGLLATALGLPDRRVRTLTRAGRLHDLGKIVVETQVLRKPGRLSDAEFESMRAHPAVSSRLLAPFSFAAEEARLVELHHERFDGRGYYNVAGSELPLEAHFLILADAWDAMTSDRPYRKALTHDEAAARIREGLGTQFHPHLGRAFVAAVEGRDPAQDVDAAQLRAIRRVLGRRAPHLDLRVLQGLRATLHRRELRLLTAGAAGAAALAVLLPHRSAVLVTVGALTAGVAIWRHGRAKVGVRSTVAALTGRDAPTDLAGAVGVVDAEYPLLWAGVLRDDEHGRLRPVEAWTSAAAPASTDALVERALRRAGEQPPGESGRAPSVGGRPLTLIRQADGWTGVVAARGPLPEPVLRALSAAASPAETPPGRPAVDDAPARLKVAA